MFFNLILLNRQHKAHFGIAWVAGLRGVQHVNKKNVLELNIGKLCDDIAEYVCSESDSPRSRFSLRLSAILINGTIKLYKQKATYLLDDLVKVLTVFTTPAIISLGIMETPPSPVPKTRTKKRRRTEKSTPQSQLEQLVADIKAQEAGQVEFAELAVEPAVLEARADEVTLREAHVPHGELAHEEFGILGVFQPLEGEPLPEFVREQEGVPQPPSSKVGEETVVPLVQEKVVPVELASKVTSSTESEGAPRTITVEAQVHVSAQVEPSKRAPRGEPDSLSIQTSQVAVETPAEVQEFRVEQSEEVQQLGEELRKIESITRARPILGQMQIGAVEDRDTQIQLRRIRKKNDEDLAKLVINVKQSRVVRINRCEPNEVEWIDINPCPLPEVNIKVPNLTNLVNMYLIRDDRDLVKRRKTSEGASLRDSLPLQRKSGRVTPPAEFLTEATVIPPLLEERVEEQPVAEVHVIADTLQLPTETQVPEPLLASTPVIRKETEIAQKTVEEVMHVTVEELAVSPRKKRKLADMEPQFEKELDFITLPTDLPSGELTVSALTIAQQTVDSVPVPVVTEQSRQQDIVHKVFIKGRCTLEEVSQRPINKLNIARAFNDILVLCRYNYVQLISEGKSSELKFIERGFKMNR